MSNKELDGLFRFCVANANAEGSFDEILLKGWFETALEACLRFVGWTGARTVRENVFASDDGSISLTYTPDSEVRVYSGHNLIFKGMANGNRLMALIDFCCFCDLCVEYEVGAEVPCPIPATFKMAVANVFAYIVEHRGDENATTSVIEASGSLSYLKNLRPVVHFA